MLAAFKKHIETHFPFIKGKKILLAISGGIDSVILAHLFQQSKTEFILAHCNFRLRGKEADLDEQFVKDLGQNLGLSVYTESFNTEAYAKEHKLSIQMAARELRYNWFNKILEENTLDYIATAHHLDDNLETFLINFTRGTGLNGLTGIPEVNGNVIRPLLPFSREEIEQYAQENNIIWREDASNAKTAYQRNKLRHQVIPVLKEMNPNLLSSFQKTTMYLKESQDIIDHTIANLKKNLVIPAQVENREIQRKLVQKIDIKKLKEFSNPKAYLFELLKGYGFTEWSDVENLLEAQSGKQLLSETHRLVKDRDHFLLEVYSPKNSKEQFLINHGQETLITENFSIRLTENNTSNFKENVLSAICVDVDRLQFPLELRKKKEGDYFYPLGMTGKKKISKFFKDEKLSLIDKENAWLLCSKDTIVWVINRRLDDRFKVTSNTKKTILIEYIKN